MAYYYGFLPLGLVSLISNGFFAPSAEVRRKIRVIVWGTVAGLFPGMILQIAVAFTGKQVPELFPVWFWAPLVFGSFWLFPLSFAYAVVKHRVLEIPVLLKRSARYFMVQRGFVLIQVLSGTALTIVLTLALSRAFKSGSQFAIPVVLTAGVIFGSVLTLSGLRIHHAVTRRIDRAFFRSAYDARQILESLVDETRTVTSREELGVLLGGEIKQALHPTSAAVYLADRDGQLRVHPDTLPPKFQPLPSGMPLLEESARRREPWEISRPDSSGGTVPGGLSIFAPIHPECLVPILMRNGELTGLLVLGPRVSEEPYSREDKRLLGSVAAQAGVTLENMRLAEDMAERIEAERRASRDMEIAKQVQARLFPQKLPLLHTLEYAGRCIQARHVGGDYYDFLSLGSGRIGMVLADIAGKGIPGALLMANLQADVRSQCAIASQDLPQFLKSVNQSFFESTDEGSYATLFFGDYQDSDRRLRFANCGHNPPFLVRSNGTTERLTATATVLGLFEKWESSICDVQVAPEDILVIYTDGITEANNSAGEEFGERRLLDTIRANLALPVPLILDAVLTAALEFSQSAPGDDLTLVVARGR
jgi:sigma-B regulation protein RsbU (phosphoserine phosphatase)